MLTTEPRATAAGNRAEPGALTFCDLSMFYCEQGGGIRTYHRAKIDWFSRQSRHHYVLVAPGPAFRETRLADTVTLIEFFGATTGHGPDGYRVPVDLRRLRQILRRVNADIVEASDPWVTGPCALVARRRGDVRGLLTSFFHTDSLGAYVMPWLGRRRLPAAGRTVLERWSSRIFWRAQAMYDHTLVSSPSTRRRLETAGLTQVVHVPFGLDPAFLQTRPRLATSGRPARLLYAARLQPEKGIDLLLETLSRFVDPPQVQVTIAGAGPFAERVSALALPGVRFVGDVADRDAMRRLYREHDILLSPSATETFGLTTLEAMASGLVVVGADAGGIGDLMEQAHSPFVFRAGDAQAFLRALERAVGGDRREPARRARRVAEHHGSWADAVRRQVEMYEEMVAERRVRLGSGSPRRLVRPATRPLGCRGPVPAED